MRRIIPAYRLWDDGYFRPEVVQVNTAGGETVVINFSLGCNASKKGEGKRALGIVMTMKLLIFVKMEMTVTFPLPVLPTIDSTQMNRVSLNEERRGIDGSVRRSSLTDPDPEARLNMEGNVVKDSWTGLHG